VLGSSPSSSVSAARRSAAAVHARCLWSTGGHAGCAGGETRGTPSPTAFSQPKYLGRHLLPDGITVAIWDEDSLVPLKELWVRRLFHLGYLVSCGFVVPFVSTQKQ
jgi:hypothetical protein